MTVPTLSRALDKSRYIYESICRHYVNKKNMLSKQAFLYVFQMVTAEPATSNSTAENPEGGTTFGKLKQTLSSSLLTAQDRGKSTKISKRFNKKSKLERKI